MAEVPEMSLAEMVTMAREGILEQEQAQATMLGWAGRFELMREKTEWDDNSIREVLEAIDYEDAQRFRALLRCGRIRMFGSANVDTENGGFKDPGGWVHFGAEFWSTYGYREDVHSEDLQNNGDYNRWGNRALTALADHVLHLQATEQLRFSKGPSYEA